MVSVLGRIGQIGYASLLLLGMGWAAILMKLVHFLPLSKSMVEGLSLMMVQLSWRCAVLFCPWVRISKDESSDSWADATKGLEMKALTDETSTEGQPPQKERPLFIISNHTSFFDTIFSVIEFPQSVLWRSRTYMKDDLYKLPILGTICRCVGHFPVYYASSDDGAYKVDTVKMEQVDKDVNKHLSNGGWLCYFPEGAINKNPDKLLPLRYGSFKKALDFDAKLVSMVSYGNTEVWPRKAAVGGFPGKVKYNVKILTPDGTRAFAAELRKKAEAEDPNNVPENQVLVANACQVMMQKQYDDLKASMTGKASIKED